MREWTSSRAPAGTVPGEALPESTHRAGAASHPRPHHLVAPQAERHPGPPMEPMMSLWRNHDRQDEKKSAPWDGRLPCPMAPVLHQRKFRSDVSNNIRSREVPFRQSVPIRVRSGPLAVPSSERMDRFCRALGSRPESHDRRAADVGDERSVPIHVRPLPESEWHRGCVRNSWFRNRRREGSTSLVPAGAGPHLGAFQLSGTGRASERLARRRAEPWMGIPRANRVPRPGLRTRPRMAWPGRFGRGDKGGPEGR